MTCGQAHKTQRARGLGLNCEVLQGVQAHKLTHIRERTGFHLLGGGAGRKLQSGYARLSFPHKENFLDETLED